MPREIQRRSYLVSSVTGLLFAFVVILVTSSRLEAGAWVQKTSLPYYMPVGASAVALDGKIYVIGGIVTPSPSYDNTNDVSVYDPVTDTWAKGKNMNTARGFLATAVVNGKIYAIGGGYPIPLSTVEMYDPITNNWTYKKPLPKPYEGTRAAVVNGVIYVVSGNMTDSTCYAYDPTTDVWTEKQPHPGVGVGAIAYNGLIYTFGGGPAPAGPVTNAVWAYDPQTNVWTSRRAMPTARAGLWTYIVCGKIYVIGGYQQWGSSIAKVEVYDPATDSWASRQDMPFTSCFHTGAAVDGKIYVMAGTSDMQYGYGLNWEYEPCLDDPNSCIWSQCSTLSVGRTGSCATELDGKIYLLGGFGSGALDNTDLNTVFDPVTRTWENREHMDTARAFLAAAAVNGKIYAIGGGYPQPISKVAMYDPATNLWTPRENLLKQNTGSRAAVVNGIIYLVGGNSGNSRDSACYAYDPGSNHWTEVQSHPSGSGAGATAYKGLIYTFGGGGIVDPVSAAVWAYDPATNHWMRKRDMPTARAGVCTYVVHGKIIVIGGFQAQNSGLARVEVYDPATDTWRAGTDIPLTTCFATGAAIDGKIYVMAGTSDWVWGDPTIWMYNPAVDPKLTTGIEEVTTRPKVMVLEQNYPNPFNPLTTIKYTVAGAGSSGLGARKTTLVVYDVLGRWVATLVDEVKAPGSYEVRFDGSGLASGVYIYRLASGSFTESRRMILLK